MSRGKSLTTAHRTLVLAKRRAAEPSLDPRRRTGAASRGKAAADGLRANTAAGPPTVTMRSGGGRSAKHGSDVVDDGLFGRADKPRRAHDDLNDVHGSPGALVEAHAELAGEMIENQVPAVERLQHQDLLDRGLSFARRRTDQQQGLRATRLCRSLGRRFEIAGSVICWKTYRLGRTRQAATCWSGCGNAAHDPHSVAAVFAGGRRQQR